MTYILDLENLSDVFGIATPIILLIWFYYSQKQKLAKNYFSDIDGIYAGFTEAISKVPDKNGLYAGIIMNIIETDGKGYFKGELDFAESLSETTGNKGGFKTIFDGNYTFLGEMKFKSFLNRKRHPFRSKENRIYDGRLYIIDRLEPQIDNNSFEDLLSAEYEIKHYREMKVLEFTLIKVYKSDHPSLPEYFRLYKKLGKNHSPYRNVKDIIFIDRARTDF